MDGMFYQARDLNLREEVRDIILLSQERLPLLENIRTMSPDVMVDKYHWYQESTRPYLGKLTADATVGTTTLSLNADLFKTVVNGNYVLQIFDTDDNLKEQVKVVSVDAGAGTVEVVRGYGTPEVDLNTDDVVKVVSVTSPDGEYTRNFKVSDRYLVENYWQEIEHTVNVTERALMFEYKDRENLLLEERVRMMREHLRLVDHTILNSRGYYDPNPTGQNTVKGIEQLIEETNGITQADLGYTSGAFSYSHWQALQRELANRDSDVMYILTNSQTKTKLVEMVKSANDGDYVKQVSDNTPQVAGLYHDGIVASEWDGRIFRFVIDNKAVRGNRFYLVDFNSIALVPAVKNGQELMYNIDKINLENPKKYEEKIRSMFTLRLEYGEKMAALANV